MALKDKAARAAYYKTYYAKNRDKQLAKAKAYGKEHRDERREYEQGWRAQNPEKVKAQYQRYIESHGYEFNRAKQRALYAAHPEWREVGRVRGAAYRQKRKAVIFAFYGNCCACCGERNPSVLTIDHVNNDGAEHRRHLLGTRTRSGGDLMYAWLIRNEFPEGFQLLCYNCNCAKPKGSCGPHRPGPISEHWYFTNKEACGSMPGAVRN